MKNFIFFASICCFITAITTVVIHLFPYVEMTFDERVLLYRDASYLNNRYLIIAHSFLFFMAMWGVFLTLYKKTITYSGLGILFFGIFSITEIMRQLSVLFYLNGLKEKYIESVNPTVREIMKVSIENFSFTNYTLYTLFIIAFGLGAIFYGVALLNTREVNHSKLLGICMLIWGIGSFLAFGNVFWRFQWLGSIIAPYNLYYQSFMRLLIAFWLWKVHKNQQFKEVLK